MATTFKEEQVDNAYLIYLMADQVGVCPEETSPNRFRFTYTVTEHTPEMDVEEAITYLNSLKTTS